MSLVVVNFLVESVLIDGWLMSWIWYSQSNFLFSLFCILQIGILVAVGMVMHSMQELAKG